MLYMYSGGTIVVPPFWHTMGFYRASITYLKLFLGKDFRYDNPQGVAVTFFKERDNPKSIRDDVILTLFGVNSNRHEIVYNVGLKSIRKYGKKGEGKGEFYKPYGIYAIPSGEVWVVDRGNNRVVRLKYEKDTLRWVKSYGGFNSPTDIALDYSGKVYITDTGNDRVVIMDTSGFIIKEVKGLNNPFGIDVIDASDPYNRTDMWGEGKESFFVVSDMHGISLKKFDLNGKLLRTISVYDMGLVDSRLNYIAIDAFGDIYVTDTENNTIHKFTKDLEYLISVGKEGAGPYEFKSPRGISIWKRYGQLYVAEREGGQYYWLSSDAFLEGFFPEKFGQKEEGVTVGLYFTDFVYLDIDIFDMNDNPVRTLTPTRYIAKPGELLIAWDGRDDNGNEVPPGKYRIEIEATPLQKLAYYSRRMYRKKIEGYVWKY